jgi:hypothetical protein
MKEVAWAATVAIILSHICAGLYCAQNTLIYIIIFDPHNNPVKWTVFVQIFKGKNWNSERLIDLPKVAQRVRGQVRRLHYDKRRYS